MRILKTIAIAVLISLPVCAQQEQNNWTNPFLNTAVVVDGNQYQTVNQVYSQYPNGIPGAIFLTNSSPTSNIVFLTDPFTNTFPLNAPTVTLLPTASCGGVATDARLATGSVMTVQLRGLDTIGNWIAAPAVTSAAGDATGTQCLQVTSPVAMLGLAAWRVYAGICGSPGPCTTFFLLQTSDGLTTIQTFGGGGKKFNVTSSAYANCATTGGNIGNNGGPTTAWECGAQPIPTHPGLHVAGQSLYLGQGIFETKVPITYDGNGIFKGLAQNATTLKLHAAAPNGIPVPMEPYGGLVTGGGGTANNQLAVQYAYTDGATGTDLPIGVSMQTIFPLFPPTGTWQVNVVNPAPPLLQVPWQPNMKVWPSSTVDSRQGGSRITDGQNPRAIWVMCGAAGVSCNGAGPFFTNASAWPGTGSSCATPGTTQINDGDARWLCLYKGLTISATSFNFSDELWDNATTAFWIEVLSPNCTSAGSAAVFTGKAFGALATDNTCKWVNIGDNGMVKPSFNAYVQSCSAATTKYCSAVKLVNVCTGTTNTTFCNGGFNRDFSGCSSFNGQTASCGSGQAVATSNYLTTGAGAVLPTPTVAAVACPTGFGSPGAQWAGVNSFAQYAFATPMGLAPPFQESAAAAPAGGTNCFKITAPTNPPPDSVGVMPLLATGNAQNLAEDVFPPDGENVICGDGDSSRYVSGLEHGELCKFGQDITIVRPLSTVISPRPLNSANPPYFNTSDNILSCVTTPLMTPANGEQFFGRVENMKIEAGRALNQIETFGGGIFNNSCQEHSGVFHVNFADAAAYNYYALGPGAQNSGAEDLHDIGANMDYKQAVRIENVNSFRGDFGGTNNAPSLSSLTNYMSRNGLRILSTGWSPNSPMHATVMGIFDEDAFDALGVFNAGVVLIQSQTTTTANRRPAFNVHFEPYSANSSAQLLLGHSSTCELVDDLLSNFNALQTQPPCNTPGQSRVGTYNQNLVSETLGADSTGITATTPATGTAVFSFFRPVLSAGTYDWDCKGTYSNATLNAGFGMAFQGLGINFTGGSITGIAKVNATENAAAAADIRTGNANVTSSTTATALIATNLNGAGTVLSWEAKGTFVTPTVFEQFNLIFYTPAAGTLTIKKDSVCTLKGR